MSAQPALYKSAAHKWLQNVEQVEDCLSLVSISILQTPRLPTKNPKSWLYTLVVNQAKNLVNSNYNRRFKVLSPDKMPITYTTSNPESLLLRRETARSVQHLVSSLTSLQSAALEARLDDNLLPSSSPKYNTQKAHLRAASLKLRKSFSNYVETVPTIVVAGPNLHPSDEQ